MSVKFLPVVLQYFSKHKCISPTEGCDCFVVLSVKLQVITMIQYLPGLNITNVALITCISQF